MQIHNAIITGSFSYNGADLSNVTSSNAYSASLSSRTTDLESTSSVLVGASSSFSSVLSSVSSSQQQISASLLQVSASYIALSGSYNTFSGSASTRVTQIEQVYATTGSNSFRANQSITGSLVVSSTITAQTLVVQTVTSSIVFSSGSNSFGNQLANNQTFTGSVNITGSLAIAGPSTISKAIDVAGYGCGTRMIDFKSYFTGYDTDTIKASIYSGVSCVAPLNTQGGYMAFMTSDNGTLAERVRIEKTGNVGINTSSPAVHGNAGYATLTIVGGATNRGWLELGTSTASCNTNIFGQISGFNGTNARAGEIRFFDDGAVNKAGIDFAILNSGAINVAMRITSLGNVGIGINTPNETLDVNGTIQVRGSSLGYATTRCVTQLDFYAGAARLLSFGGNSTTCGVFRFYSAAQNNAGGSDVATISGAGAACFSSTIQASGATIASDVVGDPVYLRVRNNNTGGYPSSLALSIYGYSGTAAYFDTLRIQGSYPGYGSTNFFVKYQSTSTEVLALTLRGDGYMFSVPTYNNAWPGSSANMYVASDGSFGRITASSRRFKENIIDWSGNGLNTILALKPKTFKYKKDYVNSDLNFLGLIAEEVAEVLPYLAEYKNPDRTGLVENVRYDTIVIPLIAAIQEQQCTICSQASMINTLKTCLGII